MDSTLPIFPKPVNQTAECGLQDQYQIFMDHHKRLQDRHQAFVNHHDLLEKLYSTLMNHRYHSQDQHQILEDYYQALQEHNRDRTIFKRYRSISSRYSNSLVIGL